MLCQLKKNLMLQLNESYSMVIETIGKVCHRMEFKLCLSRLVDHCS